jgi:hypothetical protein
MPSPHRTVADGQLRHLQTPRLEGEQPLAPALRGLAHAVLDGKEVLFATGIYADHDHSTEPVLGGAQPAMDAIDPQIGPVIPAQIGLAPVAVFSGLFRLEPRDGVG